VVGRARPKTAAARTATRICSTLGDHPKPAKHDRLKTGQQG
jgi:hypothetical protein